MHGLGRVALGLGGIAGCRRCRDAEAPQRLLAEYRCFVTVEGAALLGEDAAAVAGRLLPGRIAAGGGLLLLAEARCCWRRRCCRAPVEAGCRRRRMSCCRRVAARAGLGAGPGAGPGGHLSAASRQRAVPWPGSRVCIYILTVCFFCDRGSRRGAPVRSSFPQCGGSVRAGRVQSRALRPSRRPQSAVPCAGFAVSNLVWTLCDGPEARVSKISLRVSGTRHGGVPGARARLRCTPSQRQTARCAWIRNFPLDEWSPHFGPMAQSFRAPPQLSGAHRSRALGGQAAGRCAVGAVRLDTQLPTR